MFSLPRHILEASLKNNHNQVNKVISDFGNNLLISFLENGMSLNKVNELRKDFETVTGNARLRKAFISFFKGTNLKKNKELYEVFTILSNQS